MQDVNAKFDRAAIRDRVIANATKTGKEAFPVTAMAVRFVEASLALASPAVK